MTLFNLESGLLYWFASGRTDGLTDVFNLITHAGGTKSLILVIGLTLLSLAWFRFYKEAAILFSGMSVGVITSQSLKHWINRARPEVVSHLTEFSSPSFPSGHAMNNMLFATIIIYLSWRLFKNKHLSFIVGVVMYAWAFLVGISRLYLGVHWPTDVIFGWILGLLVGGGIIWGAEKLDDGTLSFSRAKLVQNKAKRVENPEKNDQ